MSPRRRRTADRRRQRASDVNPEPKVAAAFDGVIRKLGSRQSKVGYEKDWVAFRTWLAQRSIAILQVEPDHVEQYVADLHAAGKAKSTRDRALSVLREVYRALVVRKLVASNPAREVRNIRHGGTKRTPWLDEDQLAKMLGFHGDSWRDRRDRLCVQLLAGTGWRRSEVARMRAEDFSGGVIRGVVKGGKEAQATVPPWLAAEIAGWRAYARIDAGPLLPRSADGRRAVSDVIVHNIVKRVAAKVGVPLEKATPHAIRRSLATLADARGVPLKDIQEQLGHQSIVTTERYLKGSRVLAHAPSEWMGELSKNNP